MAETATKAMRVTNPELQAMAKIDEILAPMGTSSQHRVVAWMISTYIGGTVTFKCGDQPTVPMATE